MKNKSSLLIISMLVFAGLMAFAATAPAQAAEGDHVVYIGVIEGQLAYNETEIDLEPNTEYTIVFVNEDATTGHNLRIDVDGDVSSSTLGDTDDILIGVENDAEGGTNGSWNATWTTPDAGEEVTYYCGFSGHYAGGMEGTFYIGDQGAPGFGLFAGIAGALIAALAVPRLRRN